MEGQALAQREGPHLGVGRGGVLVDHLRLRLAGHVHAEQRVVDHVAVVARDERGGPDRIQDLQVGLRHHAQHLGAVLCRSAGGGEAPAARPQASADEGTSVHGSHLSGRGMEGQCDVHGWEWRRPAQSAGALRAAAMSCGSEALISSPVATSLSRQRLSTASSSALSVAQQGLLHEAAERIGFQHDGLAGVGQFQADVPGVGRADRARHPAAADQRRNGLGGQGLLQRSVLDQAAQREPRLGRDEAHQPQVAQGGAAFLLIDARRRGLGGLVGEIQGQGQVVELDVQGWAHDAGGS